MCLPHRILVLLFIFTDTFCYIISLVIRAEVLPLTSFPVLCPTQWNKAEMLMSLFFFFICKQAFGLLYGSGFTGVIPAEVYSPLGINLSLCPSLAASILIFFSALECRGKKSCKCVK